MSNLIINGTVINDHPVFEGSQVLTSDQLNSMFGYLDQRDRYTRSRMIGIGIVCGLHVSVSGTDIIISKGMGITSDGYLIKVDEEIKLKHRRQYNLPSDTVYEGFGKYDDNNIFSQGVIVDELLETEPADSDSLVDTFAIDGGFLSGKYILLFMECFDIDPRSCFSKKCEDLGKTRTFTLRVLAVDQTNLDQVLGFCDDAGRADYGDDSLANLGVVGNPFHEASSLPYIDLKKPQFDPKNNESRIYSYFTDQYKNVLKDTSVDGQNILALLFGTGLADNNSPGDERGVLHETYQVFEPLLKEAYNHQNPLSLDSEGILDTAKTDIYSLLEENEPIGIQYLYEYFQLLIKAYEEFVSEASQLVSQCMPRKYFPLHIMLGKVTFDDLKETDEWNSLGESRYRHQFIQPKVLNSQNLLMKKVISLHKRLVLMVEKFDISRIGEAVQPPQTESIDALIAKNSSLTVKITPDRNTGPLGGSTIPMYFHATAKGTTEGVRSTTLEQEWNFDRTIVSRGQIGIRNLRVLSYERNEITPTAPTVSDPTSITAPLLYDTTGYSYRIDGLFGDPYQIDPHDTLDDERSLRDTFHLPFEVLKVQLTTDTSKVVVEEHYWEDLQSDYKVIKSAFQVTIRNFLAELKQFDGISRTWSSYGSSGTDALPFTNLDNFLDEITTAQNLIETGTTGLLVAGEAVIGQFPATIQELDEVSGTVLLFENLINDYKTFCSTTRQAHLHLKHASNILSHEKIEVMPRHLFDEWTRILHTINASIQAFLKNQDIYELFNLYYRFVARFNHLQAHHYSIFYNFLELHRGINEGAVARGGTHIIVESEVRSQGRIVASFTLPYWLDTNKIQIPLPASGRMPNNKRPRQQ
ncbi:MAG: hypothetical protein AAGA66_03325 [Bacteroidota bacterium]